MSKIEDARRALTEGRLALEAFCHGHGVQAAFHGDTPLVPVGDWKVFVEDVAMPLNRILVGHLLAIFPDDPRPPAIEDLLRYVDAYDALIRRWRVGEGGPHINRNFPEGLESLLQSLTEDPGQQVQPNL